MILSSEIFDKLLRQLKTDKTVGDKRSAQRIGVRAEVQMIRLTNGVADTSQHVCTRNISKTGIGILTQHTMKSGQLFILEFPGVDGPPTRMLCQVKRREKIESDLYHIGANFVRQIENSQRLAG